LSCVTRLILRCLHRDITFMLSGGCAKNEMCLQRLPRGAGEQAEADARAHAPRAPAPLLRRRLADPGLLRGKAHRKSISNWCSALMICPR